MDEELNMYLDECQDTMNKTILHFEKDLSKIRAGKASPQMLESVIVDYYGVPTPISQVSNIGIADARTIVIQPWTKSMIEHIEKGIMKANLGFTPMNNGEVIRLSIPPLTEERRKQLAKQARSEGEDAKISVRNARREANETLKKMLKEGLPEDVEKDAEASVQKIHDKYIKKVDDMLAAKEKEIMTV